MSTDFNLHAYLKRIGIREPLPPTVESLQKIHLSHVQAIAFENLNPLLGLPVSLNLPDIEKKLVYEHRGGYCFEQNLLLRAALGELGFQAREVVARVVWGGGPGARTHLLLLVSVSGRQLIADVGFGGMTLTGPVDLAHGVAQPTPHEPFRLIQNESEWTLEAQIRGDWMQLYRFDLSPVLPIDLEVGNWYTSTHPNSHFTTGLTVARPAAGCRQTLRGNELATHFVNGETEKRLLDEPDELRDVLVNVFGVRLPDHPRLEQILDRAVAASKATVAQHQR